MMSRPRSRLLSLAAALAVACGGDLGRVEVDAECDGEVEGDADGDVDVDGDADGDADGDEDRDGDGDADDTPVPHPERYPTDRTHSPITAWVVESMEGIAASGEDLQDDVFAKVGNSITVAPYFLHCFGGDDIDLDGRDALLDAVLFFRGGDAAGTSPFDRESLTAIGGWPAARAVEGDPSPLEQEVEAILPRFAVVMYGTNDIGWYGMDAGTLDWYAGNMLDIADLLVGRGVVPIMSTIPPRDDSAAADLWVPRYNLVVRGIAEALQVPLVDLHRELLVLPDHGLAGDGVHPSAYVSGTTRPCIFTAEALEHGYNVRNLLTIEALDRARRVLVDGEAPPDLPEAGELLGDGSPEDPFLVEALPFTDLRSTLLSPHRSIDVYTACSPADESGPELTYELDLAAPATIRATVLDRGEVDIDVHLLDERGTAEGCLARDHRSVVADLPAGRYFVVADTFVSSTGTELSGEYLLTIAEE